MFIKGLNIYHIVILALMVVIAIMWLQEPQEPSDEEYIKIGSREYILLKNQRDTLLLPQRTIIKHRDFHTTELKIETVEVPAEIDTLEVLKAYYAKYNYTNIYPIDSIGEVTVTETISQNRIISRSLMFDYDIPLIRETIYVKDKPRNKYYLGGGLNLNTSIYASALMITRKDRIFAIHGGLTTMNNIYEPYLGMGIYFKIR